jgi:hypothetical protein
MFRSSRVPWWLFDSDLRPADPPCASRDLVKDGQPQRQVAFFVSGQFVPTLTLMAVRCERRQTSTGEELWPLSVAWPCEDLPLEPGDIVTGQSGGNRNERQLPDDNGANDDDGELT